MRAAVIIRVALVAWVASCAIGCATQSAVADGEALTFTVENDKVTGSDNNYTNGIGASWVSADVNRYDPASYLAAAGHVGGSVEWRILPVGTLGVGNYFTGAGMGVYGEVGWNLVDAFGVTSETLHRHELGRHVCATSQSHVEPRCDVLHQHVRNTAREH